MRTSSERHLIPTGQSAKAGLRLQNAEAGLQSARSGPLSREAPMREGSVAVYPATESASGAAGALPLIDHRLVAKREVDASLDRPIVYREYAFAVAPGTGLEEVERLLWVKVKAAMEELSAQTVRKFVQLAVFDHAFVSGPERAPLAVIIWKDWRGDPTLAFPSDPKRISQWPFGGTDVPTVSIPAPSALPSIVSEDPPVAAAAGSAAREEAEVAAVAPAQAPTPARISKPSHSKIAKGRDPVADLVSDLFDRIHELAFCRGVIEGADFVLDVTSKLIPTKHCLVHIFDIDSSEFVLVRAAGVNHESVLLSRIPDRDPWISGVMRRALATRSASEVGTQDRWRKLGTAPASALAIPVRVGGRYLGLLELADPLDGADFFENELNALAYLAERFAEFLAARPIVLDSDVVMTVRPKAR